MLALFTINELILVYSRYSIVAYWVAGWMSGNPAQEQHQPHLCGCWSPQTPRYSPNTSRSWRRRVSETTLSSSTNCWMSSWTSASHRPQTAKSCRSEWAVGGRNLGRVGRVSLGLSAHLPAGCARYITQQGNKLETGKSRVPPTVTNAVSWRSEGIKYKKNEVFIDVIESVNLLVSLHASAPPWLHQGPGEGALCFLLTASHITSVCVLRSMPTAVSC